MDSLFLVFTGFLIGIVFAFLLAILLISGHSISKKDIR